MRQLLPADWRRQSFSTAVPVGAEEDSRPGKVGAGVDAARAGVREGLESLVEDGVSGDAEFNGFLRSGVGKELHLCRVAEDAALDVDFGGLVGIDAADLAEPDGVVTKEGVAEDECVHRRGDGQQFAFFSCSTRMPSKSSPVARERARWGSRSGCRYRCRSETRSWSAACARKCPGIPRS